MLRPRRIIRRNILDHSRRIHESPQSSLVLSKEMRGHLKWIEQKYLLGQDMILLGLPTSLKRRLVVQVAQLNGWNIEYLAITRDTTESDLKQRREIIGNTVIYSDQPPVKAAIKGNILILDGIENAERNVLPTLNNLLENREMSLDDGRFLTRPPTNLNDFNNTTSNLVFVHNNFRVIALGLPIPPFSGRSLDPPLRSRFQCRFIEEPSTESLLSVSDISGVDSNKVQILINLYESLASIRATLKSEDFNLSGLPVFSSDSFFQSLHLLKTYPELTPFETISRFIPAVNWLQYLLPDKLKSPLNIAVKSLRSERNTTQSPTYRFISSTPVPNNPQLRKYQFQLLANSRSFLSGSEEISTYFPSKHSSHTFHQSNSTLLPSQSQILTDMLMDHTIGQHICLLGPKGCGKSVIAREFARVAGYESAFVFPLYSELTSRDLLQRRIITSDGNTTWSDTPLIRAVREGGICILDGIHALDVHALISLRRLLQDGVVNLPDGETLHIDPTSTFRVIALGLPPDQIKSTPGKILDHQLRYITSDLNFAYHYVPEGSPEDIMTLLKSSITDPLSTQRLDVMFGAIKALHEIAGSIIKYKLLPILQ